MEKVNGYTPAPICNIKDCPEKTSARLFDGENRKDLCKGHALPVWRLYRNDGLVVEGAWNELTMNDFKSEDDEEDEVRATIDLDHPWIEAAQVMQPVPVPTQMKFEMVTIQNPEDGSEQPCAMLTIITQTGVQNFFLDHVFFNSFLMAGAQTLAEIGEYLQNQQQGKLIVADKGMERAVIQEQKIHERIREGR